MTLKYVDDIWVCNDCFDVIEFGADAAVDEGVVSEVESALAELNCELVNDSHDETTLRCRECNHIGTTDNFEVHYTKDDDEVFTCPGCKTTHDNYERRGPGYDEFSLDACECCGSRLGGARYRYQRFELSGREAQWATDDLAKLKEQNRPAMTINMITKAISG